MVQIKPRRFNPTPPQVLVSGIVFIIIIGTFLLSLPVSTVSHKATPFIDAMFIAASASCVTGLTVLDIATHYNLFGQIVIMTLIQIGGIGFMTVASLYYMVLRKKISLRERLILQQAMNQSTMEGIVRLIQKVLLFTFIIQFVGAALLAARWSYDMGLSRAIYFGIFHSISLFNNAGFDIFGGGQSFSAYVNDPTVNIVSSVLIIMGGIGFVVMSELLEFRRNKRLSLHSKVVLSVTGMLLAVGTVVIFIFEFTNANTLGGLNWDGKIFGAFFQTASTRTAGATSVELGDFRQATQFFIIILMFIGGSPGSTASGIKTTTFAILLGALIAMVRGRNDIVMFRYRLPQDRIYKAITLTLLSLFLVIFVAMLLSMTEDHDFLMILFETTSAFGTVGATMGMTPDLTTFGKIVIALTMFVGRLGPLTLAYALGRPKEKELYRHPEGNIIIG